MPPHATAGNTAAALQQRRRTRRLLAADALRSQRHAPAVTRIGAHVCTARRPGHSTHADPGQAAGNHVKAPQAGIGSMFSRYVVKPESLACHAICRGASSPPGFGSRPTVPGLPTPAFQTTPAERSAQAAQVKRAGSRGRMAAPAAGPSSSTPSASIWQQGGEAGLAAVAGYNNMYRVQAQTATAQAQSGMQP